MTPAGRASAAMEVLGDLAGRKRPAAAALKDWGLAHRFAGSGDRAAIGSLVFDCLRKRASLSFAMEDESPRALVLRALASDWQMSPEAIEALCDGSRFAPAPLSPAERDGLARAVGSDAPSFIQGDYPAWLEDAFTALFGEGAADQGAALSVRAPVDLRVNTLKANASGFAIGSSDCVLASAIPVPSSRSISVLIQLLLSLLRRDATTRAHSTPSKPS
ncbi:MAG: hypothetical protein AAF405_02750 [Pseudomonadota bacterium]